MTYKLNYGKSVSASRNNFELREPIGAQLVRSNVI
jgi:hypothetical protein